MFRTFVEQARKADSNLRDADSVFVALLEAIIDRTADILEKVGAEIDTISGKVFEDDVKSSSAARITRRSCAGSAAAATSIRRCGKAW